MKDCKTWAAELLAERSLISDMSAAVVLAIFADSVQRDAIEHFAREAVAKLRSEQAAWGGGRPSARDAHHSDGLGDAASIVEALARPNYSKSSNSSSEKDSPKFTPQALTDFAARGYKRETRTVSFPALPIDLEAEELVDGLLAKARGRTQSREDNRGFMHYPDCTYFESGECSCDPPAACKHDPGDDVCPRCGQP